MINNKIFAFVLILAGFLGISAVANNQSDKCVDVIVDFGSLNHNMKVISCVDVSKKESALVVLDKAGFNIEGTKKYGNQIVCRVNSLPNFHQETCESMPPEDAYWAVIVKKKLSPLDVKKEWNWADTGVSDVYLGPGDSLGLVFVKNEEMRWPG